MEWFFSFNWIALFALGVVLLLFVLIKYLIDRINWTLVILIALALGIGVGLVFSSDDGSYLTWVSVIGDIYVGIITALVAPVILVSIISSFISLRDRETMTKIGLKSVFWLILAAAAAILLSIAFGLLLNLGSSASAVFESIADVSESTVSAYDALVTSFDEVLAGLFPTNIVSDIADNNVTAIIITGIALAVAYISVVSDEGEANVVSFRSLVDALKKILYRVLEYVVDMTPYAVLCLIASSAGTIFTDTDAILQLLLLVGAIYLVAIIHTYIYNGVLIAAVGRLNPVRFFSKIAPAQATAFTTQSSVGTLPVTIDSLKNRVGVSEDIANFTAPLGTTIGMPGCTAIWPTLLVIFYVNAVGLDWGVGEYVILFIYALFLSFGSAGVPGIAVVSSIALFSGLGLPTAAVVLLIPINTISDMARTACNVTAAAVSATLVARQENQLNDEIFRGNATVKGGTTDVQA